MVTPGAKPAEGGGEVEAIRFKVLPTQILDVAGLILTVGLAFTLTLVVAVAVHPPATVAVTVKPNPPALLLLNVTGLVVLLKLPPPLCTQL